MINDRFKFMAFHKPTKKIFEVYGFNDEFVFERTDNGVLTSQYNPAKTSDCILLQCTGLKEKKGKLLIFEGDIVTDATGSLFLVVWNDESSEFCLQEDNVLHEFDNNVFVIGNIHENQDLLKGE